MPPKPKRTSQTRTRSSAKRARVTELIGTRPGPSAQQQAEASTEQPLMAVNMQALSASISNAVQLAVAEAMKAQWPAAPSQETQSSSDQSVANIVNASLAEITQDSTVQGTFTPSRRIANNSALDSFAEELFANVESLLSSVLASGSGPSYRRAWTLFREFHEKFYQTEAFHFTTASLALFISFLDGRNLSPSTILSYLSAIGYVHKMKGLHDPTKAFLIQKFLTSLSRQKSCDVRLPISKPILHDLVSSLQHTNSSAPQRILFSAMFLTAFYGFFRIGARSACHTTVIP